MGFLGSSHPPAAVMNLPGQAPCHTLSPSVYVALLPGTGVGLGPCEPLPGPQRMWSGKWEHVECVCFDLSRLCSLQRIGFWYCLCVPLGNRFTIFPLFLILQQDFKKPILPIFHQSWIVYIMTCYDVFLRQRCLEMYKDMISS